MTRERPAPAAEDLFRAARDEQPDAGFDERILARLDAASDAERSPLRPAAPRPRRNPARYVKWAFAAALMVPAIVLVARSATRPSASLVLTAEPAWSPSTTRDTPAPRAERAPEPASAAEHQATGPVPKGSARPHRAATRPAEAAAPPAPSASTTRLPLRLSEELGVLKQARAALRSGDGATALTILDQYERSANVAGLRAEGTLLRIEALAAVGRRGDAEALAERFITENRHNPLSERARTFVRSSASP